MNLRLASLVLLAVAATSCSGSSTSVPTTTSPAAQPTVAATSTTAVAITATTAPATTAIAPTTTTPLTTVATTLPEPIEAQLQRLLERYDASVVAILADPRVASDPASPNAAAFLALFPKDSSFAAGSLKVWAAEGAKGRFYRPGPSGVLFKSTLRKVTAQSATEVSFTVCTQRSAEVVDASGAVIEGIGGVNGGEINAVNVGGAWLFVDLTQVPPSDCPKAGA